MATPDPLPPLDDECFLIAPIGEVGSDERDRSDGVLDYIVAPAARELGLVAVRADRIAKPGQITRQVIEHVVGARAAVVDLTAANPNVYYEMAVRHTAELPTILVAEDGERLPFDIAQMRTIFFRHDNLKSAAHCRQQIVQHLREALGGAVDSPVAASVTVAALQQGGEQEQLLASLVERVEGQSRELRRIRDIVVESGQERVHPVAVQDLVEAYRALLAYQEARAEAEPELDDILRELERPVTYFDEQFGRRYRGRSSFSRRVREREAERQRTLEELAREGSDAGRTESEEPPQRA